MSYMYCHFSYLLIIIKQQQCKKLISFPFKFTQQYSCGWLCGALILNRHWSTTKYTVYGLMTGYDFVLVQMTEINTRDTRPLIFFIWIMHEPEGWVHCGVKKQRTSALIFVICTSTKSYQSLTSFIHIIIETIMECIYFEIRSNDQNNLIHIKLYK